MYQVFLSYATNLYTVLLFQVTYNNDLLVWLGFMAYQPVLFIQCQILFIYLEYTRLNRCQ